MDHLGLASVSQDRILPMLSPGVNVLTIHPRYWSVYCWLLTEFWERDLPRTQAAWGRFLKPRERVFVAAVLLCPRHGSAMPEVAGKRRVGLDLEAGHEPIDPQAPYLKAARGGYGIYASAIAQLGLTIGERDTDQFRCDAPTEAGRKVGKAIHEWVSGTTYYRSHFDAPDESVPRTVVAAYSKKICLCRLPEGPDLPLIEDAFLHGGSEEEALRRRASLRMICDLSSQTVEEPVANWDFRQLIYYRADDSERTYVPSHADLVPVARRWRLLQLREIQAWTLNRWLHHVNRWGVLAGGDESPIPLDEVLATVDAADFEALAEQLEVDDPGLGADDSLDDLLDWIRAEGRIHGDLDEPWDLTAPACEDRLLDLVWGQTETGDQVTATMLGLLVACALRVWPLEYQLRYAQDWPLLAQGGSRRVSVARFLDAMRSQQKAGATIGQSGRWMLEHFVLRQHHRVALGKLPDDTFRLRLDAGRVWFVDERVAVEMNDPRYRALSTCAAELDWTGPLGEADHDLTAKGRRLLAYGDLHVRQGS
jgi:hypothetical protein